MPGVPRLREEARAERVGDDVIGDGTRGSMAPVEHQFGLTPHSQRARIDHQIETASAIVEREVRRVREVRDVDRMMFARGVEFF